MTLFTVVHRYSACFGLLFPSRGVTQGRLNGCFLTKRCKTGHKRVRKVRSNSETGVEN